MDGAEMIRLMEDAAAKGKEFDFGCLHQNPISNKNSDIVSDIVSDEQDDLDLDDLDFDDTETLQFDGTKWRDILTSEEKNDKYLVEVLDYFACLVKSPSRDDVELAKDALKVCFPHQLRNLIEITKENQKTSSRFVSFKYIYKQAINGKCGTREKNTLRDAYIKKTVTVEEREERAKEESKRVLREFMSECKFQFDELCWSRDGLNRVIDFSKNANGDTVYQCIIHDTTGVDIGVKMCPESSLVKIADFAPDFPLAEISDMFMFFLQKRFDNYIAQK